MNQELNANTPGILPGGLNDTAWGKVFEAMRTVAARGLDDADLGDYISNLDRLDSPWLDYVAQYALAYPEWVATATDAEKRARIRMWIRNRTRQGTNDALQSAAAAYGIVSCHVFLASDTDNEFYETNGFKRTQSGFALLCVCNAESHASDFARYVKAVWPVGRFNGFVEHYIYDVWIVNCGNYKTIVIKSVKNYFNISLVNAKAIADATPTALSSHSSVIDGGPYNSRTAAQAVVDGLMEIILDDAPDFDGLIEIR